MDIGRHSLGHFVTSMVISFRVAHDTEHVVARQLAARREFLLSGQRGLVWGAFFRPPVLEDPLGRAIFYFLSKIEISIDTRRTGIIF